MILDYGSQVPRFGPSDNHIFMLLPNRYLTKTNGGFKIKIVFKFNINGGLKTKVNNGLIMKTGCLTN